MRAVVAEEGSVMVVRDELAWVKYLMRIWRELEDFYRERIQALDLYQAETKRLAHEQSAILDKARLKLRAGQLPSSLEQAGILHALQVVIENAIGKAKHLLQAAGEPIPVSAYDAFTSLARISVLPSADVLQWNDVIGIPHRIVHGYMNIDMAVILDLVRAARHHFVAEFLLRPISLTGEA